MIRTLLVGLSALSLTACDVRVPDSAAGVGQRATPQYRSARDMALENGHNMQVPGVQSVETTPLDTPAQQAQPNMIAANSGEAPLDASPANAAPQIVANSAGISGENDFSAVSAERDIAQDAALIARNRAQYQIIQPGALPVRPGTSRPNIVEYALRTTNPVGTPLYRRSGFNAASRYARACNGFASADLAQEEFLAKGGPQRDRRGMDPDGDGFACSWNPAPYRAAREG